MDWREPIDSLQFNDKSIAYEQIDSVAAFQVNILVDEWKRFLTLEWDLSKN